MMCFPEEGTVRGRFAIFIEVAARTAPQNAIKSPAVHYHLIGRISALPKARLMLNCEADKMTFLAPHTKKTEEHLLQTRCPLQKIGAKWPLIFARS